MNETNNENDLMVYEIGYHLLPTIDEPDVPSQSLKVKSIIEENGGAIISEEMPKMIVLAYDISKNIDSKKHKFKKAYFGWVKFEIDPSLVSNIKSNIETLGSVLRFIIIKTVRENTLHVPKVPMFKKESNDHEENDEEMVEKTKVSEEEIDKSIDELVTDQTL